MEKRFVLFIVLTMLILTGHVFLQSMLAPPRPAGDGAAGDAEVAENDRDPEQAASDSDEPAAEVAEDATTEPSLDSQDVAEQAADNSEQPPAAAQQWVTIGSYDGASGPLLVTFNSRGAGVERVELVERLPNGKLKYRSLENSSGYAGYLALTPVSSGGCRVNTVGENTPAALASPHDSDAETGLQVGDVITRVATADGGDAAISVPEDLELVLAETRPGDSVQLTVTRAGNTTITFGVRLDERPLQIIRPEPVELDEPAHPASCLLSLTSLGGSKIADQLKGAQSPRSGNWLLETVDKDSQTGVECRFPLSARQLNAVGLTGNVELIKRYWLGRGETEDGVRRDYHLDVEIEFANRGQQPQEMQYQLDGPNGLPLEGWWYSYKTHPEMFRAAGARDILLKEGGKPRTLTSCSLIYKKAKQRSERPGPDEPLADAGTQVNFAAVDTQYFVSALIPAGGGAEFDRVSATALGTLKPKRLQKTTNVSFELESPPIDVPPGASFAQKFELYVGPKRPEVLAAYGLDESVYYGWKAFGAVARPLSALLHFFYSLVGNYGIAIVMLTILVRGAMFPLSRKAAKNAAMMQELAPEMKAITEKYKNDMEKRAKAQQELFRRHNYNPLGGCWVMFLQLPIFIGLYRSLSVDAELRQAALIPGWDWCSNLAGPDQLFFWGDLGFLGLFEKTGMLGPYFNILPLGTVALFLVQQKMFTPPATDEQTRMQLQVMKFMTLFIGIMFFKVASGLCIYFIASSLWGIAERKLLPKKNTAVVEEPPVKEKRPETRQRQPSRNGPNGSPQKQGGGKKRKAKKSR